ncbi:DNA repair protein RecN [Candidatus Arthromitus sp. SFB-mouse]|uniref:DNA repair protein RecN n=1 Tax=Candidatus Arthromitus sp. SFB-mouse TaxID=49118 RepID=UPI0002296940|nr:DNA repair protein RecN [Candidatus Arthromitus sp. SFB-mouse]EGX28889.1 DNA repair protein [Candidatus Arthromitus sp. SFB-mouse-NYU]BAK79761.1 DNA repair protein RecN [Candidatus Arthromitus sp. SFB-mouse-Yit]
MLNKMRIEKFALIDNMDLEFKNGFTVISGETGSGKSILIDAICFILGFKFSKSIVRNGEDKTSVEAIFDIYHEKINEILNENGIEIEDYLFIRREGYVNGKSIVRINGHVVTNNTLKLISKYLMDIHTQHQNYELLNNAKHINYLDKYIGKKIDFKNYLDVFREWNEIRYKINEIKNNDLNDSYIEYVKFQINELTSAKLIIGEDYELEEKIRLLNNSEKISKTLNFSLDSLIYREQFAINSELINIIKSIRMIDLKDLNEISNKLEGIYYDLESISEDIKAICDKTHFDVNEFDCINARIYKINALKKKFNKMNVEELVKYNEELQLYLDNVLNQERVLKDYEKIEYEKRKQLKIEADKITEIRKKYAKMIENEIVNELNYMGMENIIFKINIEKDKYFTQTGNDNVNFFISTNKGEPLKDLSKVVSGGELSRIMLALKIVFLGNEPISGIIFDEIDTGVSGKIAQKVGEKMYSLSKRCQVFCITHLAQIASLSDNHYVVSKKIENDKTYSHIKMIGDEEKVSEIAKMIGGESITEGAFISAKELIGNKKLLE